MSRKRALTPYDASAEAATYSTIYYEKHAPYHNADNIRALYEWICHTAPTATSIVDVGCGAAEFLKAFEDAGWRVKGIDFSEGAQQKHVIKDENFLCADVSQPLNLNEHYDVVLSVEVWEHLRPEHEATYLDNLVAFTPNLLLVSCSGPENSGLHHYNPKKPADWVPLVEARGYTNHEDLWHEPGLPCAVNRSAARKACPKHFRCITPLARFYTMNTRVFTPRLVS